VAELRLNVGAKEARIVVHAALPVGLSLPIITHIFFHHSAASCSFFVTQKNNIRLPSARAWTTDLY
jgi:hypothetical protein